MLTTFASLKNKKKDLEFLRKSFPVISEVWRSFIPNELHLLSIVLLGVFQSYPGGGGGLWNPLSKRVCVNSHCSGGHSKPNCLQGRVNFREWKIALICNTVLLPVTWLSWIHWGNDIQTWSPLANSTFTPFVVKHCFITISDSLPLQKAMPVKLTRIFPGTPLTSNDYDTDTWHITNNGFYHTGHGTNVQKTFSYIFLWMKSFEFWDKIHSDFSEESNYRSPLV